MCGNIETTKRGTQTQEDTEMAKATAYCTCSTCKKTFVITAYKRNRTEADSFEQWAVENITECRDCERARINEAARKASEEAGLAELTGSEKQIAWATTIRENVTKDLREYVESIHNGTCPYLSRMSKDDIKATEDTLDWALGHTESRWWIDHRDNFNYTTQQYCRELMAK